MDKLSDDTVKIKLQKVVEQIENLQLEKFKELEKKEKKTKKLDPMQIGDTVKVDVFSKRNKNNKRLFIPYEGTVIAQHRAGFKTTITVRRIFQNVGIERVFPIYSPAISRIQVIRRAKVRKAKLYYLRGRVGKSIRLKQRFD